MACSSPNLLLVNRAFGGSKFIGPRRQEIHPVDILSTDDVFVQDIPCGKCELCRLDQRYSKALRIMLEAQSWPDSTYFITLTYRNEDLGSPDLVHSDWAQFMKNFRQKFCQAQYCNIRDRGTKRHGRVYSKTFKSIKQVMCGEYGDTFGRKHFHGVIFNHSFSDVEFTGFYSKKGNPIYSSKALEEVWGKGNVQVEKITFDLALYVGSYVTDHYDDPGINDGRTRPQYGRFGRGIGRSWLEKWWRDILASGNVMLQVDGKISTYPIPRAFRKWMEDICPTQLDKFCLEKKLTRLEESLLNIEKGDGPLRRARAKGRVFNHVREKRRKDSGDVRF